MPTGHVSWGSIELLHNVIRTLTILSEQGTPFPSVRYRAKVKLHGSNCGVHVTDSEGILTQSRTSMLTLDDDYKGFASWVRNYEDWFRTLTPGMVVFGEWCGPGVEKGMAISKLPGKVFAVFAVQVGEQVVYDPIEIRRLVPDTGTPADLFVLPWEGPEITLDFASRESLDLAATRLNAWVESVEREDPWVKMKFGITGLGEGLVFYPMTVNGEAPAADPGSLTRLMFKAKGEKHRTAGTKTAVQVDASVVASVGEFVSLMVTEARLEQGLTAASGGVRDPKSTPAFLTWVVADVKKESVAELEASGLSWEQVEKPVQVAARTWFLRK